jgi:predicted DNA-binding transcriptional regulator YafY
MTEKNREIPIFVRQADQPVVFEYPNKKGESVSRHVMPYGIKFGFVPGIHEAQWLLDAFDIEKRAARTYAIAKIAGWRAAPAPEKKGE